MSPGGFLYVVYNPPEMHRLSLICDIYIAWKASNTKHPDLFLQLDATETSSVATRPQRLIPVPHPDTASHTESSETGMSSPSRRKCSRPSSQNGGAYLDRAVFRSLEVKNTPERVAERKQQRIEAWVSGIEVEL